jgi:hypothetical protein
MQYLGEGEPFELSRERSTVVHFGNQLAEWETESAEYSYFPFVRIVSFGSSRILRAPAGACS